MWISHARIITPDSVRAGSLEVEAGRVRRLRWDSGGRRKPFRPVNAIDLRGGFLAPGFIDLHVHGAAGRDTMEATAEAFQTITEFHMRGGTTSLALTTIAAAESDLLKVLEAAQPWHNRSLGGARVLGVHLEGPFLSPHKAGAHEIRLIRPPQPAEWRRYLRYGKLVTQVTLAPEEKGALALIRALRKMGAIASGGHTVASEKQLRPALAAGLNQATHTFNCMSTAAKQGPFRVAGMLEFALAHPEIRCELIADGCHVAPTLMKMLFRAKGPDGVCLITDAMAGAGMKPGWRGHVAGPRSPVARVTRRAAFLADGSALAGSTLTMIEAVRRTVQWADVSLADAVRMASLNPARQLNRHQELGSLERGKRADLVWFDTQFQVQAAWLDGELRFWR